MIGAWPLVLWAALGFAAAWSGSARAGAYLFAGEANGVDVITHPRGYSGAGGTVVLNLCIEPGTPNEAAMRQSVANVAAVYNRLRPTIGNLRTGLIGPTQVDFESVALHELGHCLGLAHVNLASESGLSDPQANSTQSTDGADNTYDTDAGFDGFYGSGDDLRGDDVNLHWFRRDNDDPLTIADTVDNTTYARDTNLLPGGHSFAVNADRDVVVNVLDTPDTEAVMQQGTYGGEIQRHLVADDVATIRYAQAGLDEVAGTGDDYTIELRLAPQGTTSGCDITLDMNNTAGLAFCAARAASLPGSTNHLVITGAVMSFNPAYNWFFNTAGPCTATLNVPQNRWMQFSLPCAVGISTGATVADVLGDDLAGIYDQDWVVYRRDAGAQTYVKLAPTDVLDGGTGYWIYTTQAGQSFDVVGQYPAAPEVMLAGDGAGRPNLIGHPYDFSVSWVAAQFVVGSAVLSLDQAVSAGHVQRNYWIWNGTSYDAYDDQTPGMVRDLQPGDGIWIKVLTDGIRWRMRTG